MGICPRRQTITSNKMYSFDYKAPQPKDKVPHIPTSPKSIQRTASKEKLDS